MIIYNMSSSDITNYDIIIETEYYTWGITFYNAVSKQDEIIEYVINILNYPGFYQKSIEICIQVAKRIGILDKVKSILVFTKYKNLV